MILDFELEKWREDVFTTPRASVERSGQCLYDLAVICFAGETCLEVCSWRHNRYSKLSYRTSPCLTQSSHWPAVDAHRRRERETAGTPLLPSASHLGRALAGGSPPDYKSLCGHRYSVFIVLNGLFLVWNGHFTARKGAFMTRNAIFTGRNGAFVGRNDRIVTRNWLFMGRNELFTARKTVFTARKTVFTGRNGLFMTRNRLSRLDFGFSWLDFGFSWLDFQFSRVEKRTSPDEFQ